MPSRLPRWAPWVGLLVGLGSVGGAVYGFAGRFFVTSDAYAGDKAAHVQAHKAEAEALTLALVQTMEGQFRAHRSLVDAREEARDRQVGVLVCLASGGRWDALRDACDRPVPVPGPAPSPVHAPEPP